MIKIIDNCCSSTYLNCLKEMAVAADNWNFHYPPAFPIEDRFPKLEIFSNGIRHPILAGLALGLLLQIHEAGGQGLFIPEKICL